jgi:hypothetical protein
MGHTNFAPSSSFCNIPVVAAKNDVIAPTKVITIKAMDEYSNKGEYLYYAKGNGGS